MTYKQAREALFTYLSAQGWTVKADLKVPHATSPSGEVRFWFNTQSVYLSVGNAHTYGGARSTFQDIRRTPPAALENWLRAYLGTFHPGTKVEK